MSRLSEKILSKIPKLSPEEIMRIIEAQNAELEMRNAVLDADINGYVLVSRNLRVEYFNSRVSVLADCYNTKTSKVSKGFAVSDFFSDRQLVAFVTECVKQQNGNEFSYSIENPQFGKVYVQVVSHKLNGSSMLFVFQDVTLFRKMREEYLKNESLAAMTTMTAGIAHEIKNPLAAISIYLQLIQKEFDRNKGIDREKIRKSLNIISEEIERLNSITVDYLFAVRPVELKPELSDIDSVVNKACSLSEPELEAEGIVLEKDFASSLPKAEIDPALIEQSVLNLIKNAIQAMEETDEKHLLVRTYLNGDSIRIVVRDTGCGMKEEQLGKIFEPYYTTKTGGTGLGLTNIYKIIRLHGGNITVNSVYGKGSEFILDLPVPQSQRLRLEEK